MFLKFQGIITIQQRCKSFHLTVNINLASYWSQYLSYQTPRYLLPIATMLALLSLCIWHI